MDYSFKYGPPPFVMPTSTRGSINNNQIIATDVPVDLVSAVLNDSINSGDVNFDNVEIDLENLTGTSSSIANLSVNTISAFENGYIRILDDTRFEGKVLLSNSSLFDDNLLKVEGDFIVDGENGQINCDQILMKDNVIGLGISSSSLDNFINGIYFPKTDSFTGFGISSNYVGMLGIPNGTFTSNLFSISSGDSRKRFEDDKLSIRFVYISSDYDFNENKNSTDKFDNNEINYIDSLNNTGQEISNYYVNIESHNITLHGGNIISGISKDLSILLTNSSNLELEYVRLSLNDNTVILLQDLNLDKDEFNIINTGSISFTSNSSTSSSEIVNISNVSTGSVTINRDFKLIQNSVNDINIYFGGDSNNSSSNTDISIIHDDTTTQTNMLKIDKTTNNTSIFTSLILEGPKTGYSSKSMYPTLTMENSLDTITGLKSVSKQFIASKEIPANSSVDLIFNDVISIIVPDGISLDNLSSKDCMISASIIISNSTSVTTSNVHFYYKIEGMATDGADPVFVGKVISREGLELNSEKDSSGIFFEYLMDFSANTFKITAYNNIAQILRCLVKLEMLSV